MAALALLEDIANRAIRRERVFRDRADLFAHDDEWLISSQKICVALRINTNNRTFPNDGSNSIIPWGASGGRALFRARKPEEVEAAARAHVIATGGDPGNAELVLSHSTIEFGKYQGQTFRWLLENDVGYAIHLVHHHHRERESSSSEGPLMANKDALTRYSCAQPDIVELVKFHRAQEVARSRASQPGHEGAALVGFGQFKLDSLRDLYESADRSRIDYVKWLRRKTPQPGTQMDAAVRYIRRRDQERQSSAPQLAASQPAAPRPAGPTPLAPAISALLGRRSLSPGELQAKPEPSDAELVELALGVEQTDPAEVPVEVPQPPLPQPAPPSPREEEERPQQSFLPPGPAPKSAELRIPESWRGAFSREQQEWMGRELFTRNSAGNTVLTTDLRLWWCPPEPRPIFSQPPASPAAFLACRLFLWVPHRMWAFKLTCPQPGCKRPLTKAGLYKTVRRVLDIDGWYLMATEYLECRRCQKKVAGWSQGILSQLDPAHRCQFPAILTYKLSCDLRVMRLLRERALGNSATQLYTKLCEGHSEAWMRRSMQYLGECKHFLATGSERRAFPPPPPMPPVPTPVWLLDVYCYDVLSRLDEVKARVTSIFGSILKMDSTKKVTKKLAGFAADTAAWATNVGNEFGQVLISVLTSAEGEGLLPMAAGLMQRYRIAGVAPPQLMYVDRDCCSSVGGSKTAAAFHEWDELVVRLDVWHLMRRFAGGQAVRAGGEASLTKREVLMSLTKRELALHCRRRTRGAAATERLVGELIETFDCEKGHDTLGIPLLDHDRIQAIWAEQRRHLHCIQDPPGVSLYTKTRQLTKGGVKLPVFRCARGSMSLESFHLHLNRFIPGDRANAMHFQAFLLDGLVRWNENCAAVEGPAQPLLCYSGHLQHSLNQLAQEVLGQSLVMDHTKPGEYTGELIGIEYLYSQTGRVLQDVSLDPDAPDEAAVRPWMSARMRRTRASRSTRTPRSTTRPRPPSLRQPGQVIRLTHLRLGHRVRPPLRPVPSPPSPSGIFPGRPRHRSRKTLRGPDGQPGYQHVTRLAGALVALRGLESVSETTVDELVRLWGALTDADKSRLVYPSRHQDRLLRGRFKASKSKISVVAGKESLQRCLLGQASGAANWPSASRLVEAICSQLCRLHPTGFLWGGVRRTRWAAVLADYVHIRELVLDSPRLMAQTTLQLFELNQRTLSQWFSRRQRERERAVLQQAVAANPIPAVASQLLPPPQQLLRGDEVSGHLTQFTFVTPTDNSSRPCSQQVGTTRAPILPPMHTPSPLPSPILPYSVVPAQPVTALPPLSQIPRTTAWRRKKAEREAAEAAAATTTGDSTPPQNIWGCAGIRTGNLRFLNPACLQPSSTPALPLSALAPPPFGQ
ncbi:hypothetical protein SKAU_G00135470 [Synaphobranchus kaupii]|uniref:DUF6729 domain-containing protein n=1 Tax=Synaphobranchus kaupii TaxID=118154 RepID=A0A9Q1J3G8_SYNKA|nr:hypothetical protein SKAU_G00135470 [Synaphobranchus kaupii]